ncbi:MAG: cytochrome P460 family protein, partial [Candidatus Eremiobacteraeota bacterium]|nr:cytochrome P460 family protein [Candidatus Eremiobacteraeota bacterium]
MKAPLLVLVLGLAVCNIGAALSDRAAARTGTPSSAYLAYGKDGSVAFPKNYREWAYLTSGVDMNYSNDAMTMGHHMFDNVFVNPEALRVFQATGSWPDGTVFAREDRVGRT